MAVICTKCGSTNVLCEALVNPNTEKVVSYHDGAFMYGFCENCKDESVIVDTNGVKCDMEISYLKFCKVEKKEPDYAECQIVWKEDGKDERVRIKLSQNVDEATDDTIFFYCNGLEELKSLAEFGGEDFSWPDLMRQCYDNFFKSWHEEYEYWADDESALREELHNNQYEDRLYYKNGDVYVGQLNEIV